MGTAGRVFSALSLVVWLAACSAGRPKFDVAPGTGDALTPARIDLAAGNEAQALIKLSDFLRDNPGSALVDEAKFLRGKAYLMQKDRVLAADDFQRVLSDYPQSRWAPEASYLLGVAYDQLSRPSQLYQDWTEKAIGAYRGFLTAYPDRPEAAAVRERLAALEDRLARKDYDNGVLYLKMKAYDASRIYFGAVLESYPESRWSCPASLGIGEAWAGSRKWKEAGDQIQKVLDGCRDPGVVSRARKLMEKTRKELAGLSPVDTAAGPADSSASAASP